MDMMDPFTNGKGIGSQLEVSPPHGPLPVRTYPFSGWHASAEHFSKIGFFLKPLCGRLKPYGLIRVPMALKLPLLRPFSST